MKRIDIPVSDAHRPATDTCAARADGLRRIAYVDASPAVASAMARQLSRADRVHCDGYATSRIDLAELVAKVRPDLLIFDPTEIGLTGETDLSDVARTLHAAHPGTRLICYANGSDEYLVRGAIESRLHGCVSKQSDIDQLEIAVAAILKGGVYFDPYFLRAVWGLTARMTPEGGLSEREQEVIMRTARGQSAKQIAGDLGISSKTVDTYRGRAQRKLGLGLRSELVDYAVAHGWMS